MTVGELIEWCAPDRFDYYMRHLYQVWYEEASFNQELLCAKLQLTIHQLHKLFIEFDQKHETL